MTKMNPHRASEKKRVLKRRLALGGVLILFVVFISSAFGSRMLSLGANQAAVFAWRASGFFETQAANVVTVFSSKQSLLQENKTLRQKVSRLEEDLTGFDSIIQENMELKTMMGRQEAVSKEKFLIAGVLSRTRNLPYDVLNIDAGERLFVRVGDIALVKHSVNEDVLGVRSAAGVVVEVFSSSSKVRLFSSAGEKTDVFLGPENIPIILEGEGGGTFLAEIPKETDVKKGDVAILPGIPGYLIAVVEDIINDPSQAFQKVTLRTPFNPLELRYVALFSGTTE